MEYPKRVLTIAGSAAGGSAGIQADLKTFQELDAYGMSIITAMVGRHPKTQKNVHLVGEEAIEAQFATAVHQVGVDGLKTGMLFTKETIELVAGLIASSEVETVVVDPVMIGKMNSKLLKEDAMEALKLKLIPLATIITPNVPEASQLLGGRTLTTVEDLKQAAVDLYQLGAKNILVKGGRLEGPAIDVLYDGQHVTTFKAPRINTIHTSGAGCTYSAAITAFLTKGLEVKEAVRFSKSFVTTAIEHGFSYTEVVGPTYHAAERKYGEAHKIIVNEG
ncbi:bifunctional hydroxymethylpyrimidine kinase/phosphomethylpyrimidine kinase [Oceanobacillus piezotolerans]|uniref:pyridoxal kinase n=1 Tax=Oceanobacillus piezotolerans TaxID=2448030 RepID=A0A498D820_9BACI|nr:bifunctional hydroxymethylpyrimidine kinase/phosphomethylpyrimidine kinase [Oceanobacillus piezotolerans]RLL42097.1 bifunctional hydroxymethylpyrimidine kinase/phosphomethylpyrimidine kinase [Oceanobacillus piezotolerans]